MASFPVDTNHAEPPLPRPSGTATSFIFSNICGNRPLHRRCPRSLHASSNHWSISNGQRGYTGSGESRIPELLASENWDFLSVGRRTSVTPLNLPGNVYSKRCGGRFGTEAGTPVVGRSKSPSDPKYALKSATARQSGSIPALYTRAYDKFAAGHGERRMRHNPLQSPSGTRPGSMLTAGPEPASHRPSIRRKSVSLKSSSRPGTGVGAKRGTTELPTGKGI